MCMLMKGGSGGGGQAHSRALQRLSAMMSSAHTSRSDRHPTADFCAATRPKRISKRSVGCPAAGDLQGVVFVF
ncbi:hypothetical protein SAMN06272765_7234 [Streptomyces sp. Ag109_G2-15]|nr:hypothetical protein SAMN06272765_7234 [Streptomyces sp. Ag109_G2-15]